MATGVFQGEVCAVTVPHQKAFLYGKRGKKFLQTVGKIRKACLSLQLSGFSMPQTIYKEELKTFLENPLLIKISALQIVSVKEDNREAFPKNIHMDSFSAFTIKFHFELPWHKLHTWFYKNGTWLNSIYFYSQFYSIYSWLYLSFSRFYFVLKAIRFLSFRFLTTSIMLPSLASIIATTLSSNSSVAGSPQIL